MSDRSSQPAGRVRGDAPYALRRGRLVNVLRNKGIEDERVLDAIGRVRRHEFTEDGFVFRAYFDEALPIGKNQTISQPFTVARQTELLQAEPGAKVLEIGTGSGYQAAVLCELGVRLFSVELHASLLERAKGVLHRLGYRLRTKAGNGYEGWPAFAPYDAIVVTAGARSVPQPLLDQLAIGGRLVIPVGGPDRQEMLRITRRSEQQFDRESFGIFSFVPFVGT
ncbi:MAG: protein-L-isoaspartate(D-aspartate) O-methyltransferase [Bacteroidota bacterium]